MWVSLHTSAMADGFNGAVEAASFHNGNWNEGGQDSLAKVYMNLGCGEFSCLPYGTANPTMAAFPGFRPSRTGLASG